MCLSNVEPYHGKEEDELVGYKVFKSRWLRGPDGEYPTEKTIVTPYTETPVKEGVWIKASDYPPKNQSAHLDYSPGWHVFDLEEDAHNEYVDEWGPGSGAFVRKVRFRGAQYVGEWTDEAVCYVADEIYIYPEP